MNRIIPRILNIVYNSNHKPFVTFLQLITYLLTSFFFFFTFFKTVTFARRGCVDCTATRCENELVNNCIILDLSRHKKDKYFFINDVKHEGSSCCNKLSRMIIIV